MSIGVIVGRFQIHNFHIGHRQLIEYAVSRHSNVLILLGVNHSPSNAKYPLDYKTREMMLMGCYPQLTVVPIADSGSDDVWSKNVDGIIDSMFLGKEIVMYGGRDSFIKHYKGKNKTQELHFVEDSATSATKVRKDIAKSPIDSTDFRAGIIYAIENLMPRIYPTVDIAMVNGDFVLLGKKPGQDKWRFPGGFVDFKDKSFEDSAKRELFEETGLGCESPLEYICNIEVPDSRNTEDTKIMTTFYWADYCFGACKAGDDLEHVGWFDFVNDDNLKDKIVTTHQGLFSALKTYYWNRS